ncbi:hypothetical protein ECTPHS_04748 [Ectothiorhodospira sp. PHS-1]|uniref:protein adenylyltransferase SelO n=1 Tax=Ectothiorhodospira sp. PHS-1 TaxID=519989 RepID=UPI00024A8A6A|nr:YdiU family protein [Ectothiorhodospira sp. PHS-1]EHQ51977.1 hypothetical protein ECTPHS_04748 [Ectothiorhodospira sp. PHS-1]
MTIPVPDPIPFSNTYARLPDTFHVRLDPDPVPDPSLIELNHDLCRELGIDPQAMSPEEWGQVFAGNRILPGSEPLAMAYAGHQFGHFVPRLGDGRAILLGEVVDVRGQRRDIQLKGSGRTPFSRGGDGRAALGPVLREYLVSEAMHALGIPSTRALAAVSTGEPVLRETVLPGAVLTRVAASHVRVGTFQYFAMRGDRAALGQLADHVADRHYPWTREADQPVLALLEAIVEAQARLVALWMGVGFIHGVMNTDNMAVSGQTIDFGPCAFMDVYHPDQVFSAIDSRGRYAYANQPAMAQWNLARLAETLLPLIGSDENQALESATDLVNSFSERFARHWIDVMGLKLGLSTADKGDIALIQGLLQAMQQGQADFTLCFRHLCDAAEDEGQDEPVRRLFTQPEAFDAWARQWRSRLRREGAMSPGARAARMRRINPACIPRNHRVEQVIAAAVEAGDFGPFRRLLKVVRNPWALAEDDQAYARPPDPAERVYQTFCGT